MKERKWPVQLHLEAVSELCDDLLNDENVHKTFEQVNQAVVNNHLTELLKAATALGNVLHEWRGRLEETPGMETEDGVVKPTFGYRHHWQATMSHKDQQMAASYYSRDGEVKLNTSMQPTPVNQALLNLIDDTYGLKDKLLLETLETLTRTRFDLQHHLISTTPNSGTFSKQTTTVDETIAKLQTAMAVFVVMNDHDTNQQLIILAQLKQVNGLTTQTLEEALDGLES